MTKPKKPAAEVDGPVPDRGGAWIRNADGSLSRDPDHEQHIPEDEGDKPVPADAEQPVLPAPVAQDQEA